MPAVFGIQDPLILSGAKISYRFAGDGFVNDGDAALVGQPYLQLIKSATDYFAISKYSFGHTISFRNSNQAVEYHGWDNTAGAWTTVLTIEPIANGGGRIWVRNLGDTDGIQLAFATDPIIKTAVKTFLDFGVANAAYVRLSTTEYQLKSTHLLAWSSGAVGAASDVILQRESAAVLSLKNGTTAQDFRVYGTTTGPKYVTMTHNGTLALVGTNAGGGDMYLGAGGINSLVIAAATGFVTPGADNTYDLGGAALQWKVGYFKQLTLNVGSIVTDTSTGLKIGTGTTQKLGFFNATPIVPQVSGENLTNNIASGGVDGTLTNWTNLSTYSTDAAAIRNAVYQLGRKLKQVNDALRLFGLLT